MYTTDVVVEECEFAESKNTNQENTNTQPAPEEAPADGFMNIPEGANDDLPFRK